MGGIEGMQIIRKDPWRLFSWTASSGAALVGQRQRRGGSNVNGIILVSLIINGLLSVLSRGIHYIRYQAPYHTMLASGRD